MDAQALAQRVVDKMFDNDPFSQWLGIERLQVAPGMCSLRMRVRTEMLNGFAIAHGGITYALSDSCLAFAANSHGVQCVSIETSISHTRQVKENDVLTAVSREIQLGRQLARYGIVVTDQHENMVALFHGTVMRTAEYWDV